MSYEIKLWDDRSSSELLIDELRAEIEERDKKIAELEAKLKERDSVRLWNENEELKVKLGIAIEALELYAMVFSGPSHAKDALEKIK